MSAPPHPLPSPLARDMQIFLACAGERSFARAAERVALGQAAVSKIIQNLERSFGRQLFERDSRGVRLTEFGKALVTSLQHTERIWTESCTRHLSNSFGTAGTFKIACHSSVALTNFPKFVPPLLEAFPQLTLKTDFMRSVDATVAVAEGHADLALVINPVKVSDLWVKRIRNEGVAIWKSHGNNQTVLLVNPQMYRVAEILRRHKGRRLIEIPDYETIGQTIKTSTLQGVLPETIAERYGLTAVSESLFKVQLAMVGHRQRLINDEKWELTEAILSFLK